MIKVYPKIAASVSLEFPFKWEYKKKGKDLEYDDSPKMGIANRISYSFKVKHDDLELIALDSKSEKKEETGFLAFINAFLDGLEYVNKGFGIFLTDDQELKIEFSPKITGSCSLKEVEGLPFVDTEYKLSIGFSPLLAMEAKTDISGELLMGVPGIGAFLVGIVKAAEAVKVADLFIGFIISGKMDVTRDFTKIEGQKEDDSSTIASTGKITICLEGHLKSSHSLYKFYYSVGAKVGAQSGFKFEDTCLKSDASGCYFPIELNFLGITLYYQVWKTFGISEETSHTPDIVREKKATLIGKIEEEDVENIDKVNKTVIVDPRTICNKSFYIFRGGRK